MITQQPKQIKETLRWRMVETSDEDSTIFNELCDCTLGHSSEFEAKHCAQLTERIKNPSVRAKAFEETKCYGCKYFGHAQIPTKLTMLTDDVSGVFRGTLLNRWCEHPEFQTEGDDYNGEYHDLENAQEQCADQDWQFYEMG